ncbi:MAG: hypothetical protein AAFU60_05020, partial [Bacteroidota bacterium]
IKVPYILMETEESLDRFEAQYWVYQPEYQDGPKADVNKHPTGREFSPFFEFETTNEPWNNNFYSTNPDNNFTPHEDYGLFANQYQGYTPAWRTTSFIDPDNITTNLGNDGYLCLYNAVPRNWDEYRAQLSGYWRGNDPLRYRNGPYGSRSGRRFHRITTLNDWQSPMFEFLQFASETSLPPSSLASYSIHNTNSWLSGAEINSQLNPYPSGGYTNIDELTIYDPPILPLTVNLQLVGIASSTGSGTSNPAAGNGTLVSNGAYVALIDFTEWVTFKDYFVYRQHMYDALNRALDMSNEYVDNSTEDCMNGEVVFQNTSEFPLPHPWNEPAFSNANYNFYDRYYKPVTAYFIHGTFPEDAHFPYPARPSGSYRFNLEGSIFDYQIDFLNRW